jgi:hypothetical protein
MPSFAAWLYARALANQNEPDLQALKTFAEQNAGRWPYWSDERLHYQKIIEDAAETSEMKSKLIGVLGENYGRWKAEQGYPTSQSWKQWFSDNISIFALVLFGVVIAVGMFLGLFRNETFYKSLATIDQARGLITFLFVFSTSAVILLIAIGIFWMDKEEGLTDRFGYAKDLLTIVIGVIGTIMGFYFGSTATTTQRADTPSAQTSRLPSQSAATPTPGEQPSR